jgi:hypothetical protein
MLLRWIHLEQPPVPGVRRADGSVELLRRNRPFPAYDALMDQWNVCDVTIGRPEPSEVALMELEVTEHDET